MTLFLKIWSHQKKQDTVTPLNKKWEPSRLTFDFFHLPGICPWRPSCMRWSRCARRAPSGVATFKGIRGIPRRTWRLSWSGPSPLAEHISRLLWISGPHLLRIKCMAHGWYQKLQLMIPRYYAHMCPHSFPKGESGRCCEVLHKAQADQDCMGLLTCMGLGVIWTFLKNKQRLEASGFKAMIFILHCSLSWVYSVQCKHYHDFPIYILYQITYNLIRSS